METITNLNLWRLKTVSVGIDVSKEKSMVCILRPYGEVVMSPIEINHTKVELSDLGRVPTNK